ncbi:MAG TPA: glycoside hydrolase family protein [Prolixibacteraceae bacterium]|nr:glycoside hydrolase family protein [Prolixibacteraceae bacterium]
MKNSFLLFLMFLLFSGVISTAQKTDIPSLKNNLQLVPQSALFEMEGYYLWDPSVIKVGDQYHLFCSRWPEETDMSGWKKSQVIRAVSKSLFGPYTFAEVVLQPENHSWATQGVHNPKIIKLNDKYLLYHLGIPVWKTGFALADEITGPWEVLDYPPISTNNPSVTVEEDGSLYAVGKHKPEPHRDGKWDAYMHAFRANNCMDDFKPVTDNVGDTLNLLPNNFELEDPSVWKHKGLYNVVCNDWEGKATGISKSMIQYVSNDGIDYKLVSTEPIWSHQEGVPLKNGGTIRLSRLERPQVFLNENNEVIAMLAAALPESGNPSFIVIRPVDRYAPNPLE